MSAAVGEAATGIGEDITSSAKDQANSLLSEFEAVARRNPLGVVIGAFGICILIGLMKVRRRCPTLLRLVGIDIKRWCGKPRSPSCSPCWRVCGDIALAFGFIALYLWLELELGIFAASAF